MPRGPGKRKMMLAPPLGGIVSGASNYELQKGNLTHHQRLVIIRKKDEEPRWTQEDLARWAKKQFGLLRQPTQSTISNILRSREKLETMTTSLDAKSARPVKHPELDAALLLWLRDRQSQLLATNGDLVRDQARQLAELFRYVDEMTYSNGWMRGFLTRHDVAFRRNQVDPRETHTLHDIQMLAAGYPRQDVFTFVSTNLWYRAEPKKDAGNPPSSGTEPSLVVGLAVNMDGSEKWSPVFVSRAKQPPSFQQKTAFQWNFSEYYYNGLAQMTSTIFEVWIKRLNQRMAQSNRRVLLVVDSAPSHINAQLSHVHVVIHADTPQFHLHPLANHLSSAFKAFYRKRQLASAVDRAEAGARDRYAVSQLKAMRWAEQAWVEVPVELVTAAWASVGFVTPMPLQLIDAEHSLPAPPSPTAKKNEIHAFLTDLLEQLDVPGRIKSHDVVTPRGEDESPHYVYNDTTIMPLVEGALQNVAEAGWEHDIVDVSELALPLDATAATSQQHRTLLVKLEQLRGVIQSIDEESAPNDEVTTVLAFLRRRQATLRADLQRLARETEQHPHPSTTSGAIDHSQQQLPVSNAAPAMQDTSMGLIV